MILHFKLTLFFAVLQALKVFQLTQALKSVLAGPVLLNFKFKKVTKRHLKYLVRQFSPLK